MSVSSVGSTNTFWFASASQPSTASPADTSGPPTDPLQALFDALSGGSQNPPSSPTASTAQPNSNQPLLSTDTMLTLLTAQTSQQPSMSDVISKFDTDGDGQISKAEFETAIGPNADTSKVDTLFNQLDTNGDGEVSADELTAAQQKAHGHHHHHHHPAPSADASQPTDPLLAIFGVGATATTGATTASASPTGAITSLPQLAQYLEQLLSQQPTLASPTTNLTI